MSIMQSFPDCLGFWGLFVFHERLLVWRLNPNDTGAAAMRLRAPRPCRWVLSMKILSSLNVKLSMTDENPFILALNIHHADACGREAELGLAQQQSPWVTIHLEVNKLSSRYILHSPPSEALQMLRGRRINLDVWAPVLYLCRDMGHQREQEKYYTAKRTKWGGRIW